MLRYVRGRQSGFGSVRYAPGADCGPRLQTGWQLVVLHSGPSRVRIHSTWQALPEHHALLLPPGPETYFQFCPDQPTHHTWVDLEPGALPSSWTHAAAAAEKMRPAQPTVIEIIHSALGHDDALGALVREVIDHLAMAAIGLHIDRDPHRPGPLPDSLMRVLALMDNRFAEPLDLKRLAGAGAVSVPHLIKLFRKHLRTTPSRYLWDLRLRRGHDFLIRTGLGIGEIADRSGFQNPYHFSRLVRERYGAPPRILRQQAAAGAKDRPEVDPIFKPEGA
ncbi:MAG: helix-turn-helix domain-containing protein [Terrimicrobiaceae bacterium]|nr:helix-turn-helix domain-containing protein [Terrimicrobiaceae bacterium]